MVEAIEAALLFCEGRQRPDLDDDLLLRFAVTHAVQIIGEAAARVSSETQERTAQLEWPVIIGMRNRLVHAYFDVDCDILWTTVKRDLPELLARLGTIEEVVGPLSSQAD
jgi:uncharacterized protein with HEPN domain